MNKLFIITFIGIVLILSLFLVSSYNEEKKVEDSVYKELDKADEINVFVQINPPEEKKGFVFKADKTDEEIKSEKKQIREEIKQLVDKEDLRHESENQISIKASLEEIEELKKSNKIKSIIVVPKVKISMQDVVNIINSTKTKSLTINGINLTGLNETICILDTGINFSHSDLVGKNRTGCLIDCVGHACVENCASVDDNGHGTHVAGIAGANGSLKGAGVYAGLIGVKVMDSSGNGEYDDINRGIDWCIDNANNYNISVISMSLAFDCNEYPQFCYDYPCDEEPINLGFTISINSAVANNISVIIASGNNGNTVDISSPSCIANATAVAATDKSDLIASYSNRNSLIDLIATGGTASPQINSTSRTGGYQLRSGTSMATPVVAGSFTVLRQAFRALKNRNPTPVELQEIFNLTGKKIYDSSTSLNYSRVDIFEAVIFIDETAPSVVLSSPPLGSTSRNINQTFICNSTDLQLKNITFYLWDSQSNLIYNETKNITGQTNSSEFNYVTNSSSYYWNCKASDARNSSAFASSNYSLIIAPIWGSIHSLHSNISDNAYVNTSSRVAALRSYYDWAATTEHDTQINASEWDTLRNEANGNNSDGNFTYFLGYEWRGSGVGDAEALIFFLDNGTSSKVNGTDANYDTFSELSVWLNSNNAMAGINHPARTGNFVNWSKGGLRNESIFPVVEILNKDNFHWNDYWNCSASSGCTTFSNPSPDSSNWNGSIKNALDAGYHLGFVGGWDYHNVPTTPNVYTGIANLDNWTRSGVFDAIRKRHVWAGQDKISMVMNSSNGISNFIMGDVFNNSANHSHIYYDIRANSGKLIKNISLFVDGIIVNYTQYSTQNVSGSFIVNYSNTNEHYIFIEAVQNDSARAWTSPMYITSGLGPEYPVISSPTTSVTTTTARIDWSSDKYSNYTFSYGTALSLGTNISNSTLSLSNSVSLSGLTSATVYYYNITSCDGSSNCITNGTYSLTTSSVSVGTQDSGGSGGGGGGGGAGGSLLLTYVLNDNEITSGISKFLKIGEKIRFKLDNISHTITVLYIDKDLDSVQISIESEPKTYTLNIGQEINVNLNSDSFYDLSVKFLSLNNSDAELYVKKINQEIPKLTGMDVKNETLNKTEEPGIDEGGNEDLLFWIMIIVTLIIIVFVLYFIIMNSKEKANNKLNKYINS